MPSWLVARRYSVPGALRVVVAAVGVGAAPAVSCPLTAADGAALAAGPVQLAWRTGAGEIRSGHHFALELRLCPAAARLQAVEATMPAHRHGMNYRPTVQALGDGRWRAEGLMFHMTGRWELLFEVELGGAAHRLRQEVDLP